MGYKKKKPWLKPKAQADSWQRWARSPVTDRYKLVRSCVVELSGGLTMPLETIIEEEVIARCKKVINKVDLSFRKARVNKRKLEDEAMRFRIIKNDNIEIL